MIPARNPLCRLSDRIDRLVRRLDSMPADPHTVEVRWMRSEAHALLTSWPRCLLEDERQWLTGVVVWMDELLDRSIPG